MNKNNTMDPDLQFAVQALSSLALVDGVYNAHSNYNMDKVLAYYLLPQYKWEYEILNQNRPDQGWLYLFFYTVINYVFEVTKHSCEYLYTKNSQKMDEISEKVYEILKSEPNIEDKLSEIKSKLSDIGELNSELNSSELMKILSKIHRFEKLKDELNNVIKEKEETYVNGKGDKENCNNHYIRHIRNAVAHFGVTFNPEKKIITFEDSKCKISCSLTQCQKLVEPFRNFIAKELENFYKQQ